MIGMWGVLIAIGIVIGLLLSMVHRRSNVAPSEALYRAALIKFGLSENEMTLVSAKQLGREGKKIEAIKLIREKTGMGLKEAKDIVDFISYQAPDPVIH